MGIVADFERELFRHSPAQFGAWHSIDLHNHSPSSHDYQGNRATAVDDISKAGVAIVMFTDHEKLPDRAFTEEVGKRAKRTILRGVELNVFVDAWGKPEGKVDKNLYFHLLVGFDPEGNQEPDYWLADLYRRCTMQSRDCGGKLVKGVAAPVELICDILDEAGAIVIPAHLHSTRDAFRSRSVDDIYSDPQFLEYARNRFTALEVTKIETAAFFDGKHAETKNLLKTCIRSSDAHTADLLGTRVSYVQMEQPTFRELRAGLELSFRTALTAPAEPASYICGLNIRGQFFPDLWLSLSPHCNALIGVKGSGKTSILECLRFALGAQVPTSRQETVTSHLQNILGPAGTVRVLIKRSDGAKLLVERAFSGQSYKVTFEDDRQEMFVNPDGLMFPSYILGWHEIEQAATDPNIRQVYLDTIAGREQIRQLREEVEAGAKRVAYLHGEGTNVHAAFRELDSQIKRLEELRKGLQELKDGNLIELRDEYEAAIRHQDAVGELRNATQQAIDQLDTRVSAIGVTAEKAAFEGTSPVSEFVAQAYDWVSDLRSKVSTFSATHRQDLVDLAHRLDELGPQVTSAFASFLTNYETRITALPKEKRRLLEFHRKVMEDTKALPRLISDRATKKREVEETLSHLITQCNEIADCLDKQTLLRQDNVRELNNQLLSFGVQLSVEPLVRRARLDDLRSRYATGANIYNELSSFASSEQRNHRRLAKAYESLKADLVSGFHLFFDSAEFSHFVGFFEDDDLKITFKVGKAGEEYSPIDQLSAGQRCTAVFPLLLKVREGPLIVDQPEDNLDNRHIADSISPALSDEKRTRQIAFTSHNANLVVLTDAEHIAVFEGTGSQGGIDGRGFLSTSKSMITKHVIAILDGGEKALKLRYRKYGTQRPN